MTVAEWIVAIFLFLLSGAMALFAVLHFLQRGFLLNNAYLYASKKEREEMDKKPYYIQSGVAFLLLFIVFLLNGLSIVLHVRWLVYVALPFIVLTVVFAILSTIWINKKRKEKQER